jgi:hypothetical protein
MKKQNLRKDLNCRMIGVVLQCIEAVQKTTGLNFNVIKDSSKKSMPVVLAKYSLIHLLLTETSLSIKEVETIMGMSQGHSRRLRNYFNEDTEIVKAINNANKQVLKQVVKMQYDDAIPF